MATLMEWPNTIHKSSKYIEIASGNGIFWFTDVKTFELNKYGFLPMSKTNAEIRYQFQGTERFDVVLYVHKFNVGETYGNKNYIF
jgi:hypothetical protein